MKHRHLHVPPAARAQDMPSAALVDVLERGDLADWRPIAAEVARDPLGPFAERVMELVAAYPMYGTSALWRAWIQRRRTLTEGDTRPGKPLSLAALRRTIGLTQTELASRMGMTQSDLSKLERRGDARLSSLQAYADALGGRLDLVFDGLGVRARVRLRGERRERKAPQARTRT